MKHLTMEELVAGLEEILRSPKDDGVLEMIVRRPRIGEREVLNAKVVQPGMIHVGDMVKKN